MKKLLTLMVILAMPLMARAANVQTTKVTVGTAFTPAAIHVTRGVPVRLEFVRTDEPTCATSIVIPDLKIEKSLVEGKTTVIEFTPSKVGELAFTCGMKMMKGKLVVK